MSVSAILTMVFVLAVTWGLFGVLLVVAARRERCKQSAEPKKTQDREK